VVILSNFSLPGGTTSSNVQEVEAQRNAGLRTALVHHPFHAWSSEQPINPKIRSLVDGKSVRLLSSGERVSCDVLVVRLPKVAERLIDGLPEIDARQVAVIVNQTPMRCYGPTASVMYDLATCRANLEERFGKTLTWFPIGPRVREALLEHHAAELPPAELGAEDWTNIIDVGAWRRDARRPEGGAVRVGRHSRDTKLKWLESPTLIRAAYPDDPGYEVHVLGGASAPERILGGLPDNWVTHPFDGVPVRDFLAGLDVYVYYCHEDLVEAFGRAILEALAVGVPVVAPLEFKSLFGDAVIYADPLEVRAQVDRIMQDPAAYERQVARAWEAVEQRFSYAAHVCRIEAMSLGRSRSPKVLLDQ
jgi:hypothetical protein